MSPRRPLLLIEALDALGSHDLDAGLRATALKPVAGTVRPLVLPWRAADDAGRAGRSQRAVRTALDTHRPDRVVIAAGREAAGEVARMLPTGLDVRWWPTAAEDSSPDRPPAPLLLATPPGPEPGPPALAHAVIEAAPGRERMPLWDGEFVLAVAPLSGPEGGAVVESFAAVAEERSGLDLVVLADPQPEFEALARRLGVGPRTHFAGPATRDAERTWLASASAVLLAWEGPLAAAWLVRVLASSVPLLPIGDRALATRVTSWLEAWDAHAAPKRKRHETTASLAAVLERGPSVERALIAGRARAARHRLGVWSPRLASPWRDSGSGQDREVA
jgi:hypothetical protein